MSDINFRLGSSKEPKGHAVIYFVEEENIFVSYVVDFPITVDMSKYILKSGLRYNGNRSL